MLIYNQNTSDWTIEADGTMVHKKNNYIIEGDRLNEGNWIAHMTEKRWCNLLDFLAAFFEACVRAGLKKVTIDPSYKF